MKLKGITTSYGNEQPERIKSPISTKVGWIGCGCRCIGCGACENLRPSRPYSAIYEEGHERHRTLKYGTSMCTSVSYPNPMDIVLRVASRNLPITLEC